DLNYRIIPIVFETTGGVAKGTTRFLKELAEAGESSNRIRSSSRAFTRWRARLIAALHRGNAQVTLAATTRTRQAARDGERPIRIQDD
ncbi:MAG: hypothetical protein GY836_20480, partial [Herbaspirillum sp.]|uniref:hypothetical protein n=1 Tax=Herbaspirillum sp. TaxID=1890675 RepID=UPI00258A5DD6